jgi:prephenate dehydratase
MLWLPLLLALTGCSTAVTAASPFQSLLNNNLPSSTVARGGSSSAPHPDPTTAVTDRIIRVAYQGEPGAYSEKSTRELLGQKVIAVGRPSFEDCFRAVASMECDYACLPIENSLGGSIHENYDLMLRYDLTIVGEHEFRVKHCLLAKPGVKRGDIKYAISHPQALAQVDNFLRGLGITPVPTYDTAGSAKMISENKGLPDKCTPENTAAIASDLAGTTYGLDCLDSGIEDDDTNFTRFLLLARKDVAQYLNQNIPAKTSVVFTLKNKPGALYKALACFSLRDIDFSKIESRPTSASLLNFLKFKSQQTGKKSRNKANIVRFRYCFYLDFLANQLDENTQNALAHLREQADFVRILGSYPQKSRLVGPVAQEVEMIKNMAVNAKDVSLSSLPSDTEDTKPLNIGIVGFGAFGQFLAQRLSKSHRVSCMDTQDRVRRDA